MLSCRGESGKVLLLEALAIFGRLGAKKDIYSAGESSAKENEIIDDASGSDIG
jgi:hypothetical protein